MVSPFDLTGPMMPPASGGPPKQIVLLLHGLGSDGNDLIGLAPSWAPLLPDAVFVSPNAPFPCDMAPMGYQWFSLADRSLDSKLAGVRAAAPILDAFIDGLLQRFNLGADKLALVGFSQGTMMSLYVAPRRPRAVAGVVGYSGALVGADALAGETKSKPPVLLVHGTGDPVVPHQATEQAAIALKSAGLEVDVMLRPGLPHSIDEAGLRAGGAFLKRVLAPARAEV